MRTTLVINDNLLTEAIKWSEASTKTSVISEALTLLIQIKKRKRLIEMAGKIELSVDTDITRQR
jgi:hypothetical protein